MSDSAGVVRRKPLRVLMVEDSVGDAALLEVELTNAGYDVTSLRVDNEAAMEGALASGQWDVITVDHAIPGFGSLPALRVLKQTGRDIPFIVVSGSINDQTAVAAMRAGAHDYVLKDNLSRLVPAIERELQEAATRNEKRRMAHALRESEQRLRATFNCAAIGIVEVDTHGRFIAVNDRICQLLGYTREEMLAKNVQELTAPEDQIRFDEINSAVNSGRSEALAYEKRYVKKDGSHLWAHVTVSGVREVDGRVVHAIGTIEDISERKRTEEQNRVLQTQLAQAQKLEAIGQLAGGIAHDFNTVLNIILGYAGLLQSEIPENDARRERVEHIAASGRTGALLTKQLLAFSRKQAILPQALDLRDIVRDLQPMLERLLGEEIKLQVHCSDQVSPIKADPSQVQQIVLNLAANAKDAMPNGGSLTIEVRSVELDERYTHLHTSVAPGQYEMLAVTDTGVGMDCETASHIFEPFFTTKSRGKGTGLGLATVYGIVKQSGGDIWVYSEPGVGTSFKIYLPRSSDAISAPAVPVQREPESLSGHETILLVEDSEGLRQLTREILSARGYAVLLAGDGEKALELSNNHEGRIDLILTDIVMPGMRGNEVATRIAEKRRDIGVVFVSGYSEHAIAQIPGSTRIAILEKPYTADSLLRVVRETLDMKMSDL